LKLLAKAGAIFDRFLGILMFAACTIFIFAMLLVCTEVITRYGLNKPIGWAIEVCEYILVGIASLGMAWLLKEEGHVKVDFVVNRFNPKSQALITGITSALAAAAVLIIASYGLLETVHLMEMGAAETGLLRIPKAYLLFPLSIGTFLFFIQLVRRSYKHLRRWRTGEG
jgi:TRAP-type C4-dicarboxylate transport system permease small subunit